VKTSGAWHRCGISSPELGFFPHLVLKDAEVFESIGNHL